MRYVLAAFTGAGAGVLVGGLLGALLTALGPGAGDPLAGLWVVFGILLAMPAGAVVGPLVLARKTGSPGTGRLRMPFVLGALVSCGFALAFLFEEAVDEAFNLPVIAVIGGLTGMLTSKVHAQRRPSEKHDAC